MEEQIGKIVHYYDKIGVGVLRSDGVLRVGDTIHIRGKSTDFEQAVESLQLDHKNVDSAKKGDEVALKLNEKAKEGDVVYKKG